MNEMNNAAEAVEMSPAQSGVQSHDTPETRTAKPVAEGPERETRAEEIVQIAMGWSSGASLMPLPGLDLAAMLGVQIKMLSAIAALYGIPFRSEMVRPLIAALISSGGAYALASPAASLVKLVPIVGPLASAVAMPSLAVASCYATGRVFIEHFESGGTFLNFNPVKARASYAEKMKAVVKRKKTATAEAVATA
jgi:uncharacterized protein (DUF697 family)